MITTRNAMMHFPLEHCYDSSERNGKIDSGERFVRCTNFRSDFQISEQIFQVSNALRSFAPDPNEIKER